MPLLCMSVLLSSRSTNQPYLFQLCDCIFNMVYQNTVIILSIKRPKHTENGCLSPSYRVLRNFEYLPLDGSEKLPGKDIPKDLHQIPVIGVQWDSRSTRNYCTSVSITICFYWFILSEYFKPISKKFPLNRKMFSILSFRIRKLNWPSSIIGRHSYKACLNYLIDWIVGNRQKAIILWEET